MTQWIFTFSLKYNRERGSWLIPSRLPLIDVTFSTVSFLFSSIFMIARAVALSHPSPHTPRANVHQPEQILQSKSRNLTVNRISPRFIIIVRRKKKSRALVVARNSSEPLFSLASRAFSLRLRMVSREKIFALSFSVFVRNRKDRERPAAAN